MDGDEILDLEKNLDAAERLEKNLAVDPEVLALLGLESKKLPSKDTLADLDELIAGRCRAEGLKPLLKEEEKKRPKELEYIVEQICLGTVLPRLSKAARIKRTAKYLDILAAHFASDGGDRSACWKNMRTRIKARQRKQSKQRSALAKDLSKRLSAMTRQLQDSTGRGTGAANGPPSPGPLYIVGDTHGDAFSASRICDVWTREWSEDEDSAIVFLGDYVNNGLNSIGLLVQLLDLWDQHQGRVIILSGNHEFRESYYTAFKEMFEVHWDQWADHSKWLRPTYKEPPKHYGHIALELVEQFGYSQGGKLYDLFEKWGRALPYVAVIRKVMLCHSIGWKSLPTWSDVLEAKRSHLDERLLRLLGYSAWKALKRTLHAQMVNSRTIEPDMLRHLRCISDAQVFVVGHNHYRSGDRDTIRGGSLGPVAPAEDGMLASVSSSHPRSPDAGHYMAYQYEYARRTKGQAEGRAGDAFPCIIRFSGGGPVYSIKQADVVTFPEFILAT